MRYILCLVLSTLFINGCANKNKEPHATHSQLIRQCYFFSNLQIKIVQDYIDDSDYSVLFTKYVEGAPNEKVKNFLVGELKRVIDEKPENPYDYAAYRYVSCAEAHGSIVQERNAKTCLSLMLLNELAVKLKHTGNSKEEALKIISKDFPPDSFQYKFAKSSIEKWYKKNNQSISDFLHSEFSQCMKITERKSDRPKS